MHRIFFIACLAAWVLGAGVVVADDFGRDPWEWTSSVRLQAAWAPYFSDGNTQKLLVYLDPSFELELPGRMSLTAIARAYTDGFDGLDEGEFSARSFAPATRPAEVGNETELYLRELYLDAPLGPARLRLGKQQVVWGQADGIRVLDQVNAVDYREFVLADYSDARVPQWIANVEVPFGAAAIQLLWIPDGSRHVIPGIDSIDPPQPFAPTNPSFRPDIPGNAARFLDVQLQDAERPDWNSRNWDVGAQISTTFRGWDLTLNYLYQTDDVPVVAYGAAQFAFVNGRLVLQVEAGPVYKRRQLAGGSFSRAIGEFTLRGEVFYSFDQSQTTQFNVALVPHDQILRSDEVFYVAGVDWYGLPGLLLSAQLFQTHILDWQSEMIRPKVETVATFIAQHRSFENRLTLSAMWFSGIRLGDGLGRTSVRWQWSDHVSTWIGADVFCGNKEGPFGQYKHSSRADFGIELEY